jgi:hypothetical protein
MADISKRVSGERGEHGRRGDDGEIGPTGPTGPSGPVVTDQLTIEGDRPHAARPRPRRGLAGHIRSRNRTKRLGYFVPASKLACRIFEEAKVRGWNEITGAFHVIPRRGIDKTTRLMKSSPLGMKTEFLRDRKIADHRLALRVLMAKAVAEGSSVFPAPANNPNSYKILGPA